MGNILERKGYAKVGDYMDEGLEQYGLAGTIPSNRSTIVRIVPVEGTNQVELTKSLTENQRAILGTNLLDDPKRAGKIEADKIYIFEN